MKEKNFKFETSILCEDLQGIFEAFIEAFKEGKVDLHSNDKCFTLIPPKGVLLEIQAKQQVEETISEKEEESRISISISWKNTLKKTTEEASQVE